ncbi:Mevalonate kinase [Physocladia obscura]|uniref:Mevalonate kinase n=1 Tax=Physocladia obscura TaxID=109957 RepID=A0AAD5XEA6_9FUNG|nr:Mevalonate kinase [Physocladia obscura]
MIVGILVSLGVSHPSLDQIALITQKYGLVSKLTGAGGGGCAVTLIREDYDNEQLKTVINELEEAGFECFEGNVGCAGELFSIKNQSTMRFNTAEITFAVGMVLGLAAPAHGFNFEAASIFGSALKGNYVVPPSSSAPINKKVPALWAWLVNGKNIVSSSSSISAIASDDAVWTTDDVETATADSDGTSSNSTLSQLCSYALVALQQEQDACGMANSGAAQTKCLCQTEDAGSVLHYCVEDSPDLWFTDYAAAEQNRIQSCITAQIPYSELPLLPPPGSAGGKVVKAIKAALKNKNGQSSSAKFVKAYSGLFGAKSSFGTKSKIFNSKSSKTQKPNKNYSNPQNKKSSPSVGNSLGNPQINVKNHAGSH